MKTWRDHPPEILLVDFAANTLPPESGREVESHVESCPPCREYLTTLTGATSPGRLAAVEIERTRISDAFVGRQIGEYKILERLGQGGMGAVYRGEHTLIGKPVAVKVLLSSVAGDASVAQRMLTEAQAVNAVRHPNIVDIFALGRLPDGRPYLVMELLSGKSLIDVLHDQHSLSPERALPVLIEALDALAAAHAVGVVHRDLKPDNIFIDPQPDGWRVKLLDFGLAKAHRPQDAKLTRPGTLMGTPGYMSPEQVRDSEAVTHKSDVYAMGVVAWTVLSGREPFAGGTAVEVMHRHLKMEPPPLPPEACASPELEALVLRMLSKDPDLRPSAAEARAELEVIAAAPASSPRPAGAPGGRKALVTAALSVVAAGALVMGGLVWLDLNQEPPQVPGAVPFTELMAAAQPPQSSTPEPAAPTVPTEPAPVVPVELPESRLDVREALTGHRWKCEWLMGVSPVLADGVNPSILFFEMRVDAQGTILVTRDAKGGGRKKLQRLRNSVDRCRGTKKEVTAKKTRPHPSGLWTKDGRWYKGIEVLAEDLRVVEPAAPRQALQTEP